MLSMTTEISTTSLVGIIETNRENHAKRYDEAVVAFWEKAKQFVSATAEKIERKDPAFLNTKRGNGIGLGLGAALSIFGSGTEAAMPVPPTSYMDDYNQALQMVQLHQGDLVELDSRDFARLVRDKWDWSADFNGTYASLTG